MTLSVKEFIKKKEEEFENDKKIQKKILIEDNEGNLCCFNRDSWVFVIKSDSEGHVFCLERLKVAKKEEEGRAKLKEGSYVYRPGYFVLGKKGKPFIKTSCMEGELIWEGHVPLVLQEDFKKIVKNAFKKGLIKPQFLIPSPP